MPLAADVEVIPTAAVEVRPAPRVISVPLSVMPLAVNALDRLMVEVVEVRDKAPVKVEPPVVVMAPES